MGVKIQRRVVAGLRKCSREFVRRLPDTQLGHRKPQLLKLESNLDRPLVAGITRWKFCRIAVDENFR